MDDRFIELASAWFAKAQDDFAWAKDTFIDNRFGSVCFLCQQVAEKALKAYLFFHRQKLIRTFGIMHGLKIEILQKKRFALLEKLLS